MIAIGDIVKLRAKTHKMKNRIKLYGLQMKVINRDRFQIQIESLYIPRGHKEKYSCWFHDM